MKRLKTPKKERLDVLLVEKGFFSSRERAKRSIMAGTVYVDGQKLDKAGMKVDPAAEIEVREEKLRYVGRGGLKMERAMDAFGIEVRGLTCMDIGASTGGFTDCMLQNGAAKVYAVDVGYGQLDWRLRSDDRVVVMEKCNARYLTPEEVGEMVDFVSIDVSFISLGLIFPAVRKLLLPGGRGAALIKPQFEAGREEMKGTGGIVRDPAVHRAVIERVLGLALSSGLSPLGLTWSPVKGSKGNIEYLMYFQNSLSEPTSSVGAQEIDELVKTSHEAL